MLINYSNREETDKIYLHDSEFEGFKYDYENRQITMTCKNYYFKKISYFKFNNVIFSRLQSCGFWGFTLRIYAIYVIETPVEFVQEIANVQEERPDWIKSSYIGDGTEFFAVEIKVISGDAFQIVCESIEYTESEFDE